MVRAFRPASVLALVSLGKAVTLSAAGIDATVLVQLSRVRGQDLEDGRDDGKEQWYVEGGLPDVTPYAFERFPVGMTVESRAKDGTWLPSIVVSEGIGNLWNVHVSDDFPGYDVSNVPYQLVRRELVSGENDWFLDNTWLHHRGFGINYRTNKSNDYRSKEYAPWGSLVVGSDEGDGWLKTASGYLPMEVAGVQVVLQRDRNDGAKPVFDRQAQNHSAPVSYDGGETVEFRSKRGDWHEAKILGKSRYPHAYSLVVLANGYESVPVLHVPWTRLRKPMPLHSAQSDGSPTCRGDSCLLVRARSTGKSDMLLHLAKDVKMEMLLKPACKKFFNIEWSDCQEKATVVHNGQTLPVTLRVDETGLEDLSTVEIQLAANGI